jgi:large subunit ribosomal protein L24
MKIKKGDKVKIIAGKDKGKTGKVLQIFISRKLASVEGLNLLIKHMRPRKQGEKGQRIEFPAPMNLSNMMLVCPKCSKVTKMQYKYIETGAESPATSAGADGRSGKKKKKKFRSCKKCGQTID